MKLSRMLTASPCGKESTSPLEGSRGGAPRPRAAPQTHTDDTCGFGSDVERSGPGEEAASLQAGGAMDGRPRLRHVPSAPALLRRISRAALVAAKTVEPVVAELAAEWHPGRVLRSLLVLLQLSVIVYYAADLHGVYLVAQENPATSMDVRSADTLRFPAVVLCSSFAPGVPLDSLSCELTQASGRSRPCAHEVELFSIPDPMRALEHPGKGGQGASGGAAARADGDATEVNEPKPVPVSHTIVPSAFELGAANASADSMTLSQVTTPSPLHARHSTPPLPPPPLPIPSVQCIGYPSSIGPSARYDHLDLSVRVNSDQFPSEPVLRGLNLWLLPDRAYAAFTRGDAAATRLHPDVHAIETRYATRVSVEKVEVARLAQTTSVSLLAFLKFYKRCGAGVDKSPERSLSKRAARPRAPQRSRRVLVRPRCAGQTRQSIWLRPR